MKDRSILAPSHKDVNEINEQRLPEEYKIYKSYESIKDLLEEAL